MQLPGWTFREVIDGIKRMYGYGAPAPKVLRHCWHDDGASVMVAGGTKHDVRCCQCGVPTRRTVVVHHKPMPGHGPHITRPVSEDRGTPLDTEICPGTES